MLKTNYVVVDSAKRTQRDVHHYAETHNLPSNALTFHNNSSLITVNHPGHVLKTGDQITLNNVITDKVILQNALTIKAGNIYVKICHANHNYCANFKIFDTLYNMYQSFNSVYLSNINDVPILGSVPINVINNRCHTVYLTTLQDKIDVDCYFIKLDVLPQCDYQYPCIIHVYCNDLCGIPKHQFGDHFVSKSFQDAFEIDINTQAHIINSPTFNAGGHQMYYKKIKSTTPGYPKSNQMIYALGKIYQNVSQIEIMSTYFPNVFQMINATNNKLYWRYLLDGNHVNQITIPPGTYNPAELQHILMDSFSQINPDYYVNVDINEAADIIKFTTYRKQLLLDCIIIPDEIVKIKCDEIINYICIDNFLYNCDSLNNLAQLNTTKAILINCHYKDNHLLTSINTATVWNYCTHNRDTNIITHPDHNLRQGDIIITDQMINVHHIWTIVKIKDKDTYIVDINKDIKIGYCKSDIQSEISYLINAASVAICNIHINRIPNHHKSLMMIRHSNHGLIPGTTIIIDNATDVNGVPASIINNQHIIHDIMDTNHYQILLSKSYNFANINTESMQKIIVMAPDQMQILWNMPNTLAPLFGFTLQPTLFQHIISNKTRMNSSRPHNYFYLCCPEMAVMNGTEPVLDAAAMIRWNSSPTVIDGHVQGIIKSYHPVLPVLTELNLSCRHPDNSLVDFHDLNYTIVIKIMEMYSLNYHGKNI